MVGSLWVQRSEEEPLLFSFSIPSSISRDAGGVGLVLKSTSVFVLLTKLGECIAHSGRGSVRSPSRVDCFSLAPKERVASRRHVVS